jgi:hypothetical protein
MYIKAHAIRLDPQGSIRTVDAATSMVRKYSPDGQLLMQIDVGGRPAVCMDQQTVPETERPTRANNFCGTTDVAFAPNGHVFIADGYANNRILEYSSDGKKLNEWGTTGTEQDSSSCHMRFGSMTAERSMCPTGRTGGFSGST